MLKIDVELAYRSDSPCDVLLQFEVATLPGQTIIYQSLEIAPNQSLKRTSGHDKIGERMWLNINNEFSCTYCVHANINRPPAGIDKLQQDDLPDIEGEVVKYLMASRYCHLDKIDESVLEKFKGLSGGKRILAMSDWIAETFTYDIWASDASTCAHDSLATKAGVCRDYAHVLIAMARASAIPARMVSAYANNISPQDFHAMVEVYLEGKWYLLDPTQMAKPEETAIIGVGRDAADISFLTSYGYLSMTSQAVRVERLIM